MSLARTSPTSSRTGSANALTRGCREPILRRRATTRLLGKGRACRPNGKRERRRLTNPVSPPAHVPRGAAPGAARNLTGLCSLRGRGAGRFAIAMSARRLVAPFLRQLAGDPLGLGRAAQSARSERLDAADQHRRQGRAVDLPVLRRRLRPEGLRQGREGDPDRGRSRLADLPRAPVPEGLGVREAGQLADARDTRSSTARPGATDWEELSLEQATDMIAERIIRAREETWEEETDDGEPLKRTLGIHFLGGATLDSEENYLIKKFFTALGRAVDREPGPHMTQLHGPRSGDLVRARRRDHVPAGPAELRLHPDHGLEHGRAAPGRLPVGDRGQGARREGDPRRPAVHAHQRDGRPARPDPRRHDIAFLGGIVNYIFEHDAWFEEYVRHYTNGPVIIKPEFRDTEDAAASSRAGIPSTAPTRSTAGVTRDHGEATARASHEQQADVSGEQAHGAHGMQLRGGRAARARRVDAARALRAAAPPPPLRALHAGARGRACAAARREDFLAVARGAVRELRSRADVGDRLRGRLDPAHGRRAEHPRRLDRAAAAGQHRPARRRASWRCAATPTSRARPTSRRCTTSCRATSRCPTRSRTRRSTRSSSSTGRTPAPGATCGPYIVSLLKAWWGDAATEENDFCFDYLPRINGDHSHYAMMLKMLDGGVKGMFCVGQNPAVGSANSKLMRLALAKLDWLVVRDFQPIETGDVLEGLARARVRRGPRAGHPDRGVLPARAPPTPRRTATSPTPSGCCSGITRPCEPPGDARSELHWIYHLGKAIRAASSPARATRRTARSSI